MQGPFYHLNHKGPGSHYFLGLISYLLFFSQTTVASEVAVMDGDHLSLAGFVELLQDTDVRWDIEYVVSQDFSQPPGPEINGETIKLHPNRGAYWMKIVLENPRHEWDKWILEVNKPGLENLTFFEEQGHGGFRVIKTGADLVFSSRELNVPNFAFEINMEAKQRKVIYLRVHPNRLQMVELKLWRAASYGETSSRNKLFLGAFLGLLCVMSVYNFFIYISVRDRSYLYYVLFLSALTFSVMRSEGLAFQYLWPSLPVWNGWFSLAIGGVAMAFASLFARNFLRTHIYAPRMHGLLLLAALGGFAVSLTNLAGWSGLSSNISTLVSSSNIILFMTSGVLSWRGGYKPAFYFLVAWSFLLLGVFLAVLGRMELIGHSFIVDKGYYFGCALEAMLLSMGLASRINILKDEKSEAQKNMRIAEQSNAMKDEFLATTSHELRTPLNGIIGLTEALTNGVAGKLPPKANANLDMILNTGRRLAFLVNDILDFSKLKHQSLTLKRTPVDLFSVTEVVLALSRPQIVGKNLVLENKVSPQLRAVHGDEGRLQQVLHNLVGNAVKFTETGGVTVSAREQDGEVQVSVADTGPGISQEAQARIFEPFLQADGVAVNYGGTGLGLTVTRQLIGLHGGKISVESEEGKGAVFSFNLPLTNEAVQLEHACHETALETADSPSSMEPEWDEKPLTHFRVLIVDDEPVNRLVLRDHLGPHYHLTEAGNGLKALEIVESQGPFDLILLDIMMPGMTGYEVCRQLRKKHSSSQLPIIFLSARDRVEDVVGGFEAEGNDYLIKPISRSELLPRVKSHLDLLYVNRNLESLVGERTLLLENQAWRLKTLNEKLDERNKNLDDRNGELKTLVQIIKSINEKSSMKELFSDLLVQGKALFPNTQKALFLSLKEKSFLVSCTLGFEEQQFDGLEIEEGRFLQAFRRGSLVLDKGVYLPRKKSVLAMAQLLVLDDNPQSILVMTLNLHGRPVGVLLLLHEAKNGYAKSDIGKLERFRQHVMTALNKTRLIRELEVKSAQLMRGLRYTQAHLALEPMKKRMADALEDHFVLFKPKDNISSDFIWFHKMEDLHYIAVADSPDKFGGGPFLSLVGYRLLERVILEKGIESPSEILAEMQRSLKQALADQTDLSLDGQGMGMAVCCIDFFSGKILYAGASRPLYYVRDHQAKQIPACARMLGVGDLDSPFQQHELFLKTGDILYLSSAGAMAQRNQPGQCFGAERYENLLTGLPVNKMWRQGEMIWEALCQFRGPVGRDGDVTVVGIKLNLDL